MTDWNAWFAHIRMGLWTDTEYYKALSQGQTRAELGPPRNRDIAWAPFHGQHWFIAGETGYGKSNDERIVVKELMPGILAGAVEIIGFDAQLGVELQPLMDAGLLKEFHYGKEYEQDNDLPYEASFADALERHVGIMRERTVYMRKMGVNEWRITKDDPARVILIDEAGQMFRQNVDNKIKKRILGLIDTLTFQSRKCGYVVVACTQQANVENIPIRHGLTFGICHRMKTSLGYHQVTGNGMDMPPLPRNVSGLAYMSGYNKRILRTQFVPKPKRIQEPTIVNSARMPRIDELEEPVTIAGELDSYDQFQADVAQFQRQIEYR